MNQATTSKDMSNFNIYKEDVQAKIKENSDLWRERRKINRSWDAALTILTIVFTLAIAVLGTEGVEVNSDFKKASAGTLGAIVVAIQAIGNAFPVKQRAGGYRILEAQAITLENELTVATEQSELLAISKQLNSLILEAARLEQ